MPADKGLVMLMEFQWNPVWLSLKIAVAASIVVVFLGVVTAFLTSRRDFRGKDLLESVITLPLVLPPVVTGFILLVLIGKNGPIGKLLTYFGAAPIIFTPLAAVLAGITVAFPLMYQSAKAAIQSIDIQLEEAARTLGVSELKIFFTITLPLAWPGILAGIVLSFSRALGEFGATSMVAGNIPGKTQTIPIAIYFASENNDLAIAGRYVAIISLITFVMVFWVNRWARKRMRLNSVNERKSPNVEGINSKTAPGFYPER